METATVEDVNITSQLLTTSLSNGTTDDIVKKIFEVDRDVIFQPNISIIYGALFAVVIVPALLGNSLIILTFFRYYHLRTSINTYIANLAICDLLLVLLECLPIMIQYLLPTKWSSYVVNDIFCTFSFFFNTFFGTAAIMTLLALSVERFCCVIHPVTTMAFATRTQTRANFILVLVWCVSILPHFGHCVLFDSVKREMHSVAGSGDFIYDVTFCVSAKADDSLFYGSFYTATLFLLLYASTFITTLMIYLKIIRKLKHRKLKRFQNGSRQHHHHSVRRNAHDQARKQTIKLLVCSAFSYLIYYSFYFYVNLYYVYFGLYKQQGFTLILLANWFGALNACLNPIMHVLFVSKLRRGLKNFLLCKKTQPLRSDSDRNRESSVRDSNRSSIRTNHTLSPKSNRVIMAKIAVAETEDDYL